MDSSPAESSTAANKRKRVSRACDACFAKKDRCDGARPLCRVCKNLDRPCTYNRPERKRGPSQGVRQRLEGQIEGLESVLGYMVETYPHMSLEIIKHLRLDDAEYAILNSSNYNDPNFSASPPAHAINVYPRYSRLEARQMWRASSLAKAVAPSLNLSLGGEDDDEDIEPLDSMRHRIDEARAARSRLRSGIADSPNVHSVSVPVPPTYQQHYPLQPVAQHSHQGPQIAVPAPIHYQVGSPGSTSNFPSYVQQQSPKRPLYRAHHSGSASSNSYGFQNRNTPSHQFAHQHSSQMRVDQPPYSSSYSSSQSSHHQPQYGSLVEEASTPTTIPHLDEFGSSNHPPNRFEEETEALAYALGLTTYSSSPRRGGFKLPTAATPQTSSAWTDPSVSSYEMSSIDQQLRNATNQDETEPQQNLAIDFFSDYDLNMPSDNPQLSVLHQLGLQGGFGMSTPLEENGRGKNNGHSGTTPTPSALTMNTDNHSSAVQWLQPIQGIN